MRYRQYIYMCIIAVLFLFVSSCRKDNKIDEGMTDDHTLANIIVDGVINVATLSGSMSYFIYKGEEMGYEYELLNSFAESMNLKVKLNVAENEAKLFEMLDSLEVDLVAYNVPITNQGKEKYLYCGREVVNEQVLVQSKAKKDKPLRDVTELIGKDVWVIHDSKYYKRLVNLNNELGGGINIHIIDRDTITTEDLIEMVSEGSLSYTVSDLDLAKLNRTYYSNIDISLKISHPQRSSWATRQTSTDLAKVVNRWFKENENTPSYRARTKRYFELSKLPGDAPAPIIGPGQISPYDNLFKKYAETIGWDWRLLASIAYQESKFYTDRTSWAGAVGLMGLMPRTAEAFGISREERTIPEPSIKAATEFIRRLNRSFSKIEDEDERLKFIVAAYNSGAGHIYDAQALAKKLGKDPFVWTNVEECLKLKSLPEYYNDPVVKNGYFRSKETVNYIHAVMERWKYYQEKIKY